MSQLAIFRTNEERAAFFQRKAEETLQLAADAASGFVEHEARAILRKHKNLDEFVMAMGRWFFTSNGELVEPVPQYIAKSKLARFIAQYDSALKITGEPMRFTADGPVVREW